MEYAIMEIPLEFNIKNIYMFTTYRHQQIYIKAEYTVHAHRFAKDL